ncbi:hypothetical protein SARC_12919 [Sphaeroforma arctica JP610]|uniref:Uncharacterized protein n=1 Tax=Sphaeroforma arctica JP610 TaxID=667725 RepID=A0A0L0FEQ6_9EUKA|nr:hypothetical protein SARC_12919 [Sphaeroforma arctica JP610]KNC74538.1 hypothetical protein SARC_12919 [Sphaeroforma arctica JP610]|eukprot:XP_014148440.1 hypothetical protein SARC_12919 [Sphaeroforma arctica JP610]
MGRPRRATAEPVSYAENTKDSFLASALNHNSKGMGQYLSSTSMSTTIPTQRKRVRKDSIVDSAEANKENVIKKADKPDSKSKAKKGKDTKLIKSQAGVKNPNKPVGLSKRPRIEKPPISKEVVSSVKPNIKKG